MSTHSETDSEHEHQPPTATVSSLTAFARLSAARPSQETVGRAVDTLTTLDFRLLRKDTALHDLVQDCAGTILALLNNVLQQSFASGNSCSFIPDVAGILTLSFLQLLFQYRRLFRGIAARDFKPCSVPLAIVCWVDLILAKLGDVIELIAAGLDDVDHPDRLLPEFLRTQREEDILRAAIQLPDNWDMLPSVLSSDRASAAAKRLSIRLMLGSYILCPALSGHVGIDNTIYQLLPVIAGFVRQSAARVNELRFVPGPSLEYLMQQERLTSAMTISLFAAADMAQNSTIRPEHSATFRPKTMAAAMGLLRFVLRDGEHPTQTNILNRSDRPDSPTSVITRWAIVPRWTWSVWLECRNLHADTIISLTVAYIQLRKSGSGSWLDVSDLITTGGRPGELAAVISVLIDLVYRFISVLSADRYFKQVSASMMDVLDGSCRLISQGIHENSCGIQNSVECCKALMILFGYLSRNDQLFALNDRVIECLACMRAQCTRDAWKGAVEDDNFNFTEVLRHSFVQKKVSLCSSQDDLTKSDEIRAAQLMQFLVVTMFKGVQLSDPEIIVEFMDAVGERVLDAPPSDPGSLCATFLTCIASANLSGIKLPFGKASVTADEETIWRLGMCGGNTNLFVASAFSLYIASAAVNVEPLTFLEGLEHLLDMALLVCSRDYCGEDEPLALVVLPMICDALALLMEQRDDITGMYISENTRISALQSVLRSLCSRDDSMCDGFSAVLKQSVSSAAKRMHGRQETDRMEGRREYELVFCRLHGRPRLLAVHSSDVT